MLVQFRLQTHFLIKDVKIFYVLPLQMHVSVRCRVHVLRLADPFQKQEKSKPECDYRRVLHNPRLTVIFSDIS